MEASPAERLREQLAAMSPQQRNLKRLEWRWQRALPRWNNAAIRIQTVFRFVNACWSMLAGGMNSLRASRGYNCRKRVGLAKDLVAVAQRAHEMSEKALSAFQRGQFNEALEFLSTCNQADLGPTACLIRAKSLYAIGDLDGCVQDCNNIATAPPHGITEEVQSHLVFLSAAAYAKLGRWDEVVCRAAQLLSHETLGANARTLHHLALWKQDSLAYYEKVRVAEARLGKHSDFSGCACAAYQNWDKAMEYFNKAIVEHPISDELYCLRARLNFCLRAYDAARADFAQALKLKPSNVRAVEGIGQLDYVPDKYPMVTAEDIDERW